jgi:hypothetical protein
MSMTRRVHLKKGIHPFRHVVYPLSFSGWVDPPISYDMSAQFPGQGTYYVQIMTCTDGATTYVIPYVTFSPADPTAPTLPVGPITPWEFLIDGVQTSGAPVDPSGCYYMTMTVTQSAPGNQTIRHRVFITPELPPASLQNHISSGDIQKDADVFEISGIPDGRGTGGTVTVYFQHYVVTNNSDDPGGPRDLYFQQAPSFG